MRLWIDELSVLHALCPLVIAGRAVQTVNGVAIHHWNADADFGNPADIIIEGFGCGLPEACCAAMAARSPRSLWITLEYLSAEPWVASHHGLPSPHPLLPLERYFFFPGFVPGTGGLLKGRDLDARRLEFQKSAERQTAFWTEMGFGMPDRDATVVSLFGYANPAARELLDTWAAGEQTVVVAVPAGPLQMQVLEYFGASDPGPGAALRRGALEARILPFVSQVRYDELLWTSDLNFVRGEDSFVRAQWAERPLIWNIYPQTERAHRLKLDAFLDLYCVRLDRPAGDALRAFWHTWNGIDSPRHGDLPRAWAGLQHHRVCLARHAVSWTTQLVLAGGLAENLAQFCLKRLK